jgi:transcriptional regulator with XRE-family HTH domain
MRAPNIYREIGSLIRRHRRSKDLTQAELAERLGISRGALANIETGRQSVLVHQLYRFAAALEKNVHDLLPVATQINVDDLLPPDANELRESKALPLPKGLSLKQRVQIARFFAPTKGRRIDIDEGE